ncbi:hypothetical protein GN958_ATG00909 [Phytophthora infestans]|uniref:Uncharacterized protein n=1 Tax=Phytophthora infestans TaxID=4787 RepID=A0A8S9VAG4_PHYIN|nr:hypothetical protein GN958_ATG00909 [Phytophthora infestans]
MTSVACRRGSHGLKNVSEMRQLDVETPLGSLGQVCLRPVHSRFGGTGGETKNGTEFNMWRGLKGRKSVSDLAPQCSQLFRLDRNQMKRGEANGANEAEPSFADPLTIEFFSRSSFRPLAFWDYPRFRLEIRATPRDSATIAFRDSEQWL